MGFLEGLIRPFLPSAELLLVLTPLAMAFTLTTAFCVGRLRTVHQMRTAYTRKLFHFATYSMAGLLHLTLGLPGVVVFGTVVTLVMLFTVYRGDDFPFYEALARPTDYPRRALFILIPVMSTILGGGVANLLFPAFSHVGYLVCGWGDAVGEPVGSRWGRIRYRVPSLGGVPAWRSFEGSCAVFLAGSLAAFLGLAAHGSPMHSAAYIALVCGLTAALVEAVSHHGLDNCTVQVAATGVAYLLV